MFTLKIETGNASFGDDPAQEIARILREVAARLDDYGTATAQSAIRDANGNRVGSWDLVTDGPQS